MRIKGMEGGLSLKRVKIPAKVSAWTKEETERLKARQQAERMGRAEEEAALRAEPEPGYGLDGYPLQKGKRYVVNGR